MALDFPESKLSDEMVAICRKVANCPQQLFDWLVTEELASPAYLGGITKEEEKVPTLVANLLPDTGSLRIKHKSAVVRVWWLCRTSMAREENISTGRVRTDEDKLLDADITDPCHAAWVQKCSYRLFSGRLLIEATLRSLWNELSAKPRKLYVRLAEKMRAQTCVNKHDRSALIFRPGQTPTSTVDINDEVVDEYNLWLRIRAWFFSIAFLTVSENFLSPCKADYYSELILELLHQRYDGSPAPLGHFVTAYFQSARIWVEAVRDGKTLELALFFPNYSAHCVDFKRAIDNIYNSAVASNKLAWWLDIKNNPKNAKSGTDVPYSMSTSCRQTARKVQGPRVHRVVLPGGAAHQ